MEKNVSDQPVKTNLRSYNSKWKVAIGQGDDHTTSCLLGYNYFEDYYKVIAMDLSKQ